MPVFQPPTVNDLPTILPETRGVQYRLWRYYGGNPRGRSVVRIGAVYTTVDTPTTTQLEAAGNREGIDFFLGGHVYTVSAAVAAALIADGYTVGDIFLGLENGDSLITEGGDSLIPEGT